MIPFKIVLAVTPLFIYLFWGWVFNGDHYNMIPFFVSTIFIFTFVYLKSIHQNKQKSSALWIAIPYTLLNLSVSLSAGFVRSLPYLILMPLAVYFAFISVRKKSTFYFVGSITLILTSCLFIYPNLFLLMSQKDEHRNESYQNLSLLNGENELVSLNMSKIIVLDFWTTSCAACFDKFPDFENYFEEYKDNPSVEFYSVNVPLERDSFNKTLLLVDSLGYEYQTLYAVSKNEVNEMGINSYPRLVLLKNGRIRYNGSLITKPNVFVNHIKTEIDKLLKEG